LIVSNREIIIKYKIIKYKMIKSFFDGLIEDFQTQTSEVATQTDKLPESEWEYIQLANDLKEQFQQREEEIREQQKDFIPDLEHVRIRVRDLGDITIPALVGAFQVERERADEIQRAYVEVRDKQQDAVRELQQLKEEHRQRPVIKIRKKDLFLASQVRSLTNNNNNK